MKKPGLIFLLAIMVACAPHEDPRKEILRILEIQEMAYDNQSDENKKKFLETCTDSVIFVGGDDGGMLTNSQAYIEDLADGYTQKPHDRKIQIHGNTAIVTSIHQAFKMLGKDSLLINARSTKVFVKEDGKWKMAYVTYAPMPVLYNKITRLNAETLESFAGIYDFAGTRDSIYIENEKLFFGGSALSPINDSTFIGNGFFGKVIFAKDHYTFEWTDGQRIRFNKIK